MHNATNQLANDLTFTEDSDCVVRSAQMQRAFNFALQKQFKKDYKRSSLSQEFNGFEAFVRDENSHSQWIFPDIPWRDLVVDRLNGCNHASSN